jgi:hypothetical protein
MMRGRELGLTGQDLMTYQVGQVVQIGVMIEKVLDAWIEDAASRSGDPRRKPRQLSAQIDRAIELARRFPYSADRHDDICNAFEATREAMGERNRVVHDQWVAFPETPGVITRFGHFAEAEEDLSKPRGSYTHEEWEELRLRLWRAWVRIRSLTWVMLDPSGNPAFSGVDSHFAMVRGEFDITESGVVLWAAQ